MWFIGAVVGLLLGAALDMGWFTGVLAIGMAIGAQKLFGRQPAFQDTLAQADAQAATRAAASPDDGSQLSELRERVALLEDRVASLERRLEGREQPVPAAAPAAAAQAPAVRAAPAPLPREPHPAAIATPIPVSPAQPPLPAGPRPAPAPAEPLQTAAQMAAGVAQSRVAVVEPVAVPQAVEAVEAASPAPTPAATAGRPAARPDSLTDAFAARIQALIFGGNTLVKVGVLILFLGLAFLLRYTAERVTVPVELRYAAVALAGAGLLVVGWLLRRKRAEYALIVQGAGIGVLYLTILAAMKFHHLIAPQAGFALLFVVAVLSAALAVLQNASILATVAALEGFAAPVLASTGGNHPVALFTYLAVLDVGIFLVARFKAWRLQNLIGFVGTFLLAIGWAQKHYTHAQYPIVQPFLVFFFVLFALIGVLFAWRTLADMSQEAPADGLAARAGQALSRVGRVDSALVFGTPVTAFGLQYLLMRPWPYGAAWSALAFAAFYLLLARLVYARQRHGLALLAEAYVIVAVIFITLAVPLGLEGTWTGAAWAIEAAGMYWLGTRQQRPYARLLAYVVLAGAGYKLLQELWINTAVPGPVLGGTTLGPVLLAAAAFTVWALHRRAGADAQAGREAVPASLLPWVGVAALSVVPWLWLVPSKAATATALMAVAVFSVGERWRLRALLATASAQQAVAVAAFLVTLQKGTGLQPGGAALGNGVAGLVEMVLIGLSLLSTAGWTLWRARRSAIGAGLPPDWSVTSSVTAVAGVVLLHLTPLFASSLKDTATWWPLTACAVLWVALYLSHSPLAAAAAALQAAAAAIFLWYLVPAPMAAPMLGHEAFLVPLLFSAAWLLGGDWIREQARRHAQARSQESDAAAWLNPWCAEGYARWLPVVGALMFWLLAWALEIERLLARGDDLPYRPAACVLLVVATSGLASLVARWRGWRELGACTAATVPGLVVCAGLGIAQGAGAAYLPSGLGGWLVWPLALAWHLGLLRQQARWLPAAQQSLLHVLGFWLFLFLAAKECGLRMTPAGEPFSGWEVLGWLLAPSAVLWLLCTKLSGRWPVAAFRQAYLQRAFPPVVLLMLLWVAVANVASAGNASPLPYLPLLNPMELGFLLTLATALAWWRRVPPQAAVSPSPDATKIAMAFFGLFLLTGMVLRACHHWAGVPWDFGALMASRLAQAALSITWAVCGVLVMVLANRGASRRVWIGGASLLAVVVLKLFFVELADKGGLYRIVSFIAVGVLLLLVGYFAPVPPKPAAAGEEAAA